LFFPDKNKPYAQGLPIDPSRPQAKPGTSARHNHIPASPRGFATGSPRFSGPGLKPSHLSDRQTTSSRHLSLFLSSHHSTRKDYQTM